MRKLHLECVCVCFILMRYLKEELIPTSKLLSMSILNLDIIGSIALWKSMFFYLQTCKLLPTVFWPKTSCPVFFFLTLNLKFSSLWGHLSRTVVHQRHCEMKQIFLFSHPPILTRLVWDGVQASPLLISSRCFWHQSTWDYIPAPHSLSRMLLLCRKIYEN